MLASDIVKVAEPLLVRHTPPQLLLVPFPLVALDILVGFCNFGEPKLTSILLEYPENHEEVPMLLKLLNLTIVALKIGLLRFTLTIAERFEVFLQGFATELGSYRVQCCKVKVAESDSNCSQTAIAI